MTHHRQVTVTVGERTAEVDAGLAPLITELWRANIDTCRSCQRHSATRKVWLSFTTASDAEAFLNAVVGGGDDAEWARAESWSFGQYEPTSGPLLPPGVLPEHPAGWEFHTTVTDFSQETGGPPDFCIIVDVLFPTADLKRVVQRLRAWNDAAELAPAVGEG